MTATIDNDLPWQGWQWPQPEPQFENEAKLIERYETMMVGLAEATAEAARSDSEAFRFFSVWDDSDNQRGLRYSAFKA